MNHTTHPGRSSGRVLRTALEPGAALVVLSVFLAACGEPQQPARSPEATPPAAGLQEEAVPGALYHTELTFVGRSAEPSLLHLRFDNRTDSSSILLRYRGWFGDGEWREILNRVDSLPVPRAAWRVLPTGPVRIVAGEGGEPSSVILELTEGNLRLDSRGAIASWNSRTGQRESLRLAELLEESGAEEGLLLARQSARRVDEPPGEGPGQYFLVSDTAGNGLLIMRDSTWPDAPVTAWTWFEDVEAEWSDVLVLTLAATEDAPGRWSVELAEAGLSGELRGIAPALADPSGDGSGFDMFRVAASLVLDGQPWTMRGIGVQERSP